MKTLAGNSSSAARHQPVAGIRSGAEARQCSTSQADVDASPRMVMQRQRMGSLLSGARQQKAMARQAALRSKAESSTGQSDRTDMPVQRVLASGLTYQANAAVEAHLAAPSTQTRATSGKKKVAARHRVPTNWALATIADKSLVTVTAHRKRSGTKCSVVYDHEAEVNDLLVDEKHDSHFVNVHPRHEQEEHEQARKSPDSLEYRNYHTTRQPAFSSEQVTQGGIGDCWLIAPMAAMAQSPKWRPHLEANFGMNARDFTVRLYDQKKRPKDCPVTGHLATIPATTPDPAELLYAGLNKGLPDAFRRAPHETAIWPSIFEKAAATWKGGYHKLDDKEARDGFKMLAGAEPTRVTGLEMSGSWERIKTEHFDGGAPMTMTSKKDDSLSNATYRLAIETDELEPSEQEASETESSDQEPNELAPSAPGQEPPESNEPKEIFNGMLQDHVYVVTTLSSSHATLRNPHGRLDPLAPLTSDEVSEFISYVDYLPGDPPARRERADTPSTSTSSVSSSSSSLPVPRRTKRVSPAVRERLARVRDQDLRSPGDTQARFTSTASSTPNSTSSTVVPSTSAPRVKRGTKRTTASLPSKVDRKPREAETNKRNKTEGTGIGKALKKLDADVSESDT